MDTQRPRPPITESEWDSYFRLRWRVLREPWNQPRGSERDNLEAQSIHLMIKSGDGGAAAVGRLQFNTPEEAQVRYMAVAPEAQGCGLGSTLLCELEARARKDGARTIVLNAREPARAFYERNGYSVEGPAATLFGVIRHVRMRKSLSQ